ncbi:hypothetical protein BDD12DRAFT_848723 [Trichophaea hybrida]|nr:hypothetical protein BDD12DRAFT_848723 [Trichophaea hybrida]
MGSTDQTNDRFVVGVDFGTRFTSVAFAHSRTPEEVKLVQTWTNHSADQVPTEIRYTDVRTRTYQWGYEVTNTDSAESLRWFKLLLPENLKPTLSPQHGIRLNDTLRPTSAKPLNFCINRLSLSNSPEFTPPATTPAQQTARKLQELHISPVMVVSDFLGSVLKTTKNSIESTYPSDLVRNSKVEYVLTVPATWSDSARALMVKAAKGAGFGTHRDNFNLISESESAAVYTLKVIQPNLNMGDSFIICDAGKETVDLISYKIMAMEPLKLDEIVSGTSNLCGSMSLDQLFEQYIRRLLGDKVIDNMKPRVKHVMMQSWEENVKFRFDYGSAEDEYYVNVPGIRDNEEASVEDGCHTMQSDDVRKIFDPVVDRIIQLVEEQVVEVQQKGESVAAILLFGEFGSSQYLLKRLQDNNFGKKSAPLPVLLPPYARTAVVRGALLRGLDGSIDKIRRSRRSIGTLSTVERPQDYWDCEQNTWRRGYESMGEHMQWDQQTDTWRVKGRLNWLVSKGMVISEKDWVSIDLSHRIPDPSVPGDFDFSTPFFTCNHPDPPEFIWQNPTAIFKCTVCLDPSTVPLSKLKRATNSRGESFYEVKYALRFTIVDEVTVSLVVVDSLLTTSLGYEI